MRKFSRSVRSRCDVSTAMRFLTELVHTCVKIFHKIKRKTISIFTFEAAIAKIQNRFPEKTKTASILCFFFFVLEFVFVVKHYRPEKSRKYPKIQFRHFRNAFSLSSLLPPYAFLLFDEVSIRRWKLFEIKKKRNFSVPILNILPAEWHTKWK